VQVPLKQHSSTVKILAVDTVRIALRNDLRPTLRSDLRHDDGPASRQDLRGSDGPDSRLDESRNFSPSVSDARLGSGEHEAM
jgi:hypothetical protein